MVFIKPIIFLASIALLSSCGITYYTKIGWHQLKIISGKSEIHEFIKNNPSKQEIHKKLKLILEAREFGEKHIGLTPNDNYKTYYQLKEKYVSYVVNAANEFELKNHYWSYPIVGNLPYKGFPELVDAKEEAKRLKQKNFDVFIRGVSAYSTLGWFNDPVLSSFLNYNDHQLVNLILHENTHASLYIKSEAEFNEQLASFIGNQATKDFYLAKEGENSESLKLIYAEEKDEELFFNFIQNEINILKLKYQEISNLNIEIRRQKKKELLQSIHLKFKMNLLPKLNADRYKAFTETELNNARLMLYSTYNNNQKTFEKLFIHFKKDWKEFLEYCKTLENSKNPDQTIKELLISAS